jgi:AcrR family transcriptional regulator
VRTCRGALDGTRALCLRLRHTGLSTLGVGIVAKAEARERILRAASDLFYREGIRAVGVDRVVAAAGVAKMSLYKHFPTKDHLVLAFLERRDQAWREAFEAAVRAKSEDPRARIEALFTVLGDWFRSDGFRGCAFINAALELAQPEHPAFAAAVAHKEAVRAFVAQLVAEAGLDPALTDMLLLLMEGAIVQAAMGFPERIEAASAAAVLLVQVQAVRG